MTASKAVMRIFRGVISEENQRRTSRPTYYSDVANVAAVKFFERQERRARQISLDPGCGMNRLSDDLFWVLSHIGITSIDRNDNYRNDN